MADIGFSVGDKIRVVDSASKHYTKVGTVKRVGRVKLTVKFDNTLAARYVNIDMAEKVVAVTSQNDVSKVLKNLAVTVGTLIGGVKVDGEDQNVTIARLMLQFKVDVGKSCQQYRDSSAYINN